MKWMRLKVYLIPAIMQEVDTVTELYINLINEFKNTNNNECMLELLELRENITKRIEELDNFYEDNIGDTRVVHFEKARIRLKKLMMYDPDVMNKLEYENVQFRGLAYHYNNEVEMVSAKQQLVSHTGNTSAKPSSAKKVTNNNYTTNQIQSDRISNLNSKQKNETKTINFNNNNKPKSPTKTLSKKSNNNCAKEENIELNLDMTTIPTNPNLTEIVNPIIDKNNTRDDSKWREIVFRMRLTEQEYKFLLQEKSKRLLK